MSGRINTMSKVKSETSEVRMNNISSSTSLKKCDYDPNSKEMVLKKVFLVLVSITTSS